MRRVLSLSWLASGLLLSGCGAILPIMDLGYPDEESFATFVHAIAVHVRCELHKAIAVEYEPKDIDRRVLYTWAAKIALTIRANDKSTVAPGLSTVNLRQTFTFAGGASLGAEGTREMTMTYFVPFNELLNNRPKVDYAGRQLDCDNLQTGVAAPIAGNLGLHESLQAALRAWDSRNTLSERIKGGPFDTITHHVTFQVVASGSATPTWKLVRTTIDPSGQTFSATRTTTNELLLTMGPVTLGSRQELDESFSIERLRSVIRPPGG